MDIETSAFLITEDMPSLNHSYICAQIMRQLLQNDSLQPLPELTLDIGKGITPDVSIFPKGQIQPDFFEDVSKMAQLPLVAIEVISASQSVQEILTKAKVMVGAGVKTVWVVEPYGRSIIVVDSQQNQLFHNTIVRSHGVEVDFSQVFH